MTRVALALSATCLAVVAIIATRAALSDSSGAESAERVPSAATVGTGLSRTGYGVRTVDGVRMSFRVPTSGRYDWDPGPIQELPDADKDPTTAPGPGSFRHGSLYISKDVVGPQEAEAVVFWTSFPDGDHTDPCAQVLSPQIGPSAADLAGAVATAPGTELVTGPSDVSIGGHPAKHVVLTVREDVGCDPGYFYTWNAVGTMGPLWVETDVGDTIRVWIIDVNGARLFIEAETTTEALSYLENFKRPPLILEQEIQRIVESIRFD
jgi:hypothetical protein